MSSGQNSKGRQHSQEQQREACQGPGHGQPACVSVSAAADSSSDTGGSRAELLGGVRLVGGSCTFGTGFVVLSAVAETLSCGLTMRHLYIFQVIPKLRVQLFGLFYEITAHAPQRLSLCPGSHDC